MRHEPSLCEIADAVHRPAESIRDSRPAARRGERLTYMEMGEGIYVNVAYQIAVKNDAAVPVQNFLAETGNQSTSQ